VFTVKCPISSTRTVERTESFDCPIFLARCRSSSQEASSNDTEQKKNDISVQEQHRARRSCTYASSQRRATLRALHPEIIPAGVIRAVHLPMAATPQTAATTKTSECLKRR